jgi:radical SAM superfamily enzyme YgiQ (UPF0313 family)
MLLISACYSNWWIGPPGGLGWIASSLERIGLKPKLIDCQITPRYKQFILEALKEYPTVGITTTAGTISSSLEIATLIRQNSPTTKIIMGGPHPTAVYERLIPRYADIVVLGEGEDTITELMQQEDLSKIKGIAYWDGSLKVNERRPLIEDLDRLGFPAWHLYDLRRYRFATTHLPFAMITTSRGCHYDCIYCTKHVHGYKIRLRSLENVLDEIDYLVNKHSVREIRIMDDNVAFYCERVKKLCELIIGRRYKNLRFVISNGLRADNGDFEMFKLLAQAGFYLVAIGIDSASQQILDAAERKLKLESARKTIEMARKAGIRVRVPFIIGFPFDTEQTIEETISFAKSLPIDNVSFNIAIPFPGTKFYKIVQEKGKFLYDLTMNSAVFDGKAVYEMEHLKARDMDRMNCRAYREFYLRPSQIWRAINLNIESLKMLLGLLRYGLGIIFQGGQIYNKYRRLRATC